MSDADALEQLTAAAFSKRFTLVNEAKRSRGVNVLYKTRYEKLKGDVHPILCQSIATCRGRRPERTQP
jgi:plasmid maintenance system killer protein